MNIIKGPKHPKAEEKTMYEVSSSIALNTNPFSLPTDEKFTWTLYKNVKNQWKKVEGNIKYGKKAPYRFGEKVVGITFKIEVYREGKDRFGRSENKLFAILLVTPRTYKEPIIGRVILLNRGKANVNEASFTETLTAEARTSNMFGKNITFNLWEEGASEAEKDKKPKTAKVDKYGIATVKFSLMEYASQPTLMNFFSSSKTSKNFYVTASYGMKEVTNKGAVHAGSQPPKPEPKPTKTTEPESGFSFKKLMATGFVLATAPIRLVADAYKDSGVTATSVEKNDIKHEDVNECPRCKIPVTAEQLKTIFPDATPEKLRIVAETYSKYMKELKMDTCWNKAHFFAQAKIESGTALNLKTGENLRYSAEELPVKFSAFRIDKNKKYNASTNGPNELAYQYGKSKRNNYVADERMIGNIAYGTRKSLGNLGGEDGWNFRGRGMVQLTGRSNYTNMNVYSIKYLKIDILKDFEKVGTSLELAVVTSMGYLERGGMPKIGNGCSDEDKISKIVGNDVFNKKGESVNHIPKQKAFDNITSKIFKVNECTYGKTFKKKVQKGKRAPWMEIAINVAKEMKGCTEGKEPMYSKAKSYLKYCNNNFEPTDGENGPWCAAFMNWCIQQSGYSNANSAASLAPLDAVVGKKYTKIDTPVYGCILVYKHATKWKGHTGFLYGMTNSGRYILVGGNQDDTIRFDDYGEYTSNSKKKKLYGFYIPKDYEITESDSIVNSDKYETSNEINITYGISAGKPSGKTN